MCHSGIASETSQEISGIQFPLETMWLSLDLYIVTSDLPTDLFIKDMIKKIFIQITFKLG